MVYLVESLLPNQFLITDPTARRTGFELERKDWTLINRGIALVTVDVLLHPLYDWGIRDDPFCACGSKQTMSRIVNECPLSDKASCMVGTRRFTLLMKIRSLGYASSAYARRRRSRLSPS